MSLLIKIQWGYPSPEKTFKSSSPRPVAVSGLKKLSKQGLLTPPRCPHAGNPFRAASYGDMSVHQKTIDGIEHSVFRATHDGVECPFFGMSFTVYCVSVCLFFASVIIPKLSTDYSMTHHLFSEDERMAYNCTCSNLMDRFCYPMNSLFFPAVEISGDKGSSSSPSESSPLSLQSSISSDVSPSSSQTSISTPSFLNVSPSSSQTSISTSSSRPKPIPIAKGSRHRPPQKSHFTVAAAAARSSPGKSFQSNS